MKTLTFISVCGLFTAISASAQAQVAQPLFPTLAPPPMSSVMTTNSGNMSFSNGMVGGVPYSSSTQYMGNMVITNGMVGGQPFSSTTMGLGPDMSTTTVTTP